jgi:uncharacterized membrane protein (DUF4010 family)
MDNEIEIVFHLLTSLAIGLLIGIERGWSGKKEEEGDRVAGIRTFSLIGLLGGICAVITGIVGMWLLGIAFAAVAAMAVASYIVEARRHQDIGTTTAYTKILTFSLGAWAAFGYHLLALGATTLVVALLGLKPVLHKWVKGIETKELYAGIKLLIISVVLLPLLPNQGYGPWEAINPRWIWWMVVLISGISFVGYFAIKYVGNRLGTLVTSITGGLASSTAVTLSMANFARNQDTKSLFMAGVMIASSIMFIRIMVEVSIVNPLLLQPLWIPVTVMFFAVLSGGLWLLSKKSDDDHDPHIEIENPLKLMTAFKFGLLLAVILFLSIAMKEWFGDEGIYLISIISGLMDVDAITLSLSRLAIDDIDDEVAVLGIILASVTNTLTKGFIFTFLAGFKNSLELLGLMIISAILGIGTALIVI